VQAGTLDWAALSDHARAVAYLTQRPDWEDIAQEALLRLWASPAGRNQIHCRRWLAMAVRNIAIDRLRAAAVRERHGRGHTLSLDSLVLADPGSDSKRWTLLADLITGGGRHGSRRAGRRPADHLAALPAVASCLSPRAGPARPWLQAARDRPRPAHPAGHSQESIVLCDHADAANVGRC